MPKHYNSSTGKPVADLFCSPVALSTRHDQGRTIWLGKGGSRVFSSIQ
jgi:hypothetical protein